MSWYPAVSPDGQAIAFGTGGKLVVVERATRKTLMTWPTQERGLLPGWSPDSRYIMITQWDDPVSPKKYSVLVIDPVTGAVETISENTAPIGWMSEEP